MHSGSIYAFQKKPKIDRFDPKLTLAARQGLCETALSMFISNKNSHPENVPFLQTGLLKYWQKKHEPTPGRQVSVFTSDPSISMHVYGGDRDYGLMHMYCYHGFKMGFLVNRLADTRFTPASPKTFQDVEQGIYWLSVTQIGTPVMDQTAIWLRDSSGSIIKDKNGQPQNDRKLVEARAQFITGVTREDYNQNQGTKFESRSQQDEMTALWPVLLTGLHAGTDPEAVICPGRLRPKFRFSEQMQHLLAIGALIK